MESKKNYGKLSKVYRVVLIYILAVALVSFVYKQTVLNEESLSQLIPEIFMITMSFVILMIGLIKSLDGPGHPDEMGKAKHDIHLFGLMMVTIIGLGLHFYVENGAAQVSQLPYPYLSSGLISLGFLIYYVALKMNGLTFNASILSKSYKAYMHLVIKKISYVVAVEFFYIMIVVFSGAWMNYTRQGVNRVMLSIFIVGFIFIIHYLICSIYAKFSYDDQQSIDENHVKPLISKRIVLLFGVAVGYKVIFAISSHMVTRLQDYLDIEYNRLYDLMNAYFFMQYIEVSYWILMGIIGYLFYKSLIQRVSHEHDRYILKGLMILFPLYIISQNLMVIFGTEIQSSIGILRYQALLENINMLTIAITSLSLTGGLFICYAMRKNQIPACALFLAHVLTAFVGKTTIILATEYLVDEANRETISGLMNIGFIVLTSSIMLYYLIKLNNQKSNVKERVLMGGINYEHVRQ